MKFIQINDGISVRKDEICCVEKISDTTCKVYTDSNMYESKYSYGSILALLEQDSIEESLNNNINNRRDILGISNGQHWAG